MAIEHRNIPSAECHEPKGIDTAGIADTGKVITPSSTVPGTSELRRLTLEDLGDGVSVSDTAKVRVNHFTFTQLHEAKAMYMYVPSEDIAVVGHAFFVVTETPLPAPVTLTFRVNGQVQANLVIPAGAPAGTIHEASPAIPGAGPEVNPLITVESSGYAGGDNDAVVTYRYEFAQLKQTV